MSSETMDKRLKRIRLELARTPEFPDGSSKYGYEFIAPLTLDNHIDADAWKEVKDHCGVLPSGVHTAGAHITATPF
jgi:hypothetical protein